MARRLGPEGISLERGTGTNKRFINNIAMERDVATAFLLPVFLQADTGHPSVASAMRTLPASPTEETYYHRISPEGLVSSASYRGRHAG